MMGIQNEMESTGEARNHSPRLPITSLSANHQLTADSPATELAASNEVKPHSLQQSTGRGLDGKLSGEVKPSHINNDNSPITNNNELNT